MTTMQEALADRFLAAAEIPTFLAQTNDLMQRSFQNEKYGNEGQSLNPNTVGAVPSKHQNKIRSGRAARKAARSRQTLQAVGGLSYRGPWDAIKASDKPADYNMCRLESEVKSRPAGTHNERAAGMHNADGSIKRTNTPAARSAVQSSFAAAVARAKAAQATQGGA